MVLYTPAGRRTSIVLFRSTVMLYSPSIENSNVGTPHFAIGVNILSDWTVFDRANLSFVDVDDELGASRFACVA